MADINVKHENDLNQSYESLDVAAKKENLKRSADRLKTVIDAQVDELKEDASAWGKMILLVGGGIYLTFKVLGSINRSRKEAKREKRLVEKLSRARHSHASPYLPAVKKSKNSGLGLSLGGSLGGFLRHQLTLLAIAIAKRKLMSLIGDFAKR